VKKFTVTEKEEEIIKKPAIADVTEKEEGK